MTFIAEDNIVKMYLSVSKIYGANGHRQRESFNSSFATVNFKHYILVANSDITNTNDYSLLCLLSFDEITEDDVLVQCSDGAFENSVVGTVEHIYSSYVDVSLSDFRLFIKYKDLGLLIGTLIYDVQKSEHSFENIIPVCLKLIWKNLRVYSVLYPLYGENNFPTCDK